LTRAVHWFRNDLRLRDNTALIRAAASAEELLPLFVLDEGLLRHVDTGAPRVHFLLDALARLRHELAERGSRLFVRRGDPVAVVPEFLRGTGATRLFLNRDTTPYARRRDAAATSAAERQGVRVEACVDRVVFEADAVRKPSGSPYAIYSPFRRVWRQQWSTEGRPPSRAPRLPPPPPRVAQGELPTAGALGHSDDPPSIPTGGEEAARRRLRAFLEGPLRHYDRDRNAPAVDGTSRLSAHLRFGTLSIRDCVQAALEAAAEPPLRRGAHRWLDELVWREFYAAILQEHPHVLRRAHQRAFDGVSWLDDPGEFEAWCAGRTGYPLVDAGMRQLRQTGWMHNRVRMVVASFLTKDLLIDWRQGERFFFRHLVDGDPASNNGGWQWAASTGTDPQPYFRIFNPTSQSRRFDPDGRYLRRYLPELAALGEDAIHEPWREGEPSADYPPPIVDHAERRAMALARYQDARARSRQ
jgi:deoxyribodipyrimidine photo-lyase